MTAAQLETAVARTSAGRLRWLTSDANPDADQREAYRRYVRRVADEPAPNPSADSPALNRRPSAESAVQSSPANPHLAILAAVRDCPRAGPPGCGCNSSRHCEKYGRDVPIAECLRCVRAAQPRPPAAP